MKTLVNQLVELISKSLKVNFIRFAVVGMTGFIINFIGLSLLFHLLKVPILPAQLLSAEVALIGTFIGNNYWAFKGDHYRSFKQKVLAYHMSAWVGLGINSICVVLLVDYAGWFYGAALIVGGSAGLVWNYVLNRRVIFTLKNKKTTLQTDPDSLA